MPKSDATEKPEAPHWIAAQVAARAAELGLTTYALAKRCRDQGPGAPGMETLYRFVSGEQSIGSRALGCVLRALGLTIAPEPPQPPPPDPGK